MNATIGLVYIGNGAFDPRYPARDLTSDEVEAFGKNDLLKTGLYQEPSVDRRSKPISSPEKESRHNEKEKQS